MIFGLQIRDPVHHLQQACLSIGCAFAPLLEVKMRFPSLFTWASPKAIFVLGQTQGQTDPGTHIAVDKSGCTTQKKNGP